MRDLRQCSTDSPTLAADGFQLQRMPRAIAAGDDFGDKAVVDAFYDMASEVIRDAIGATRVIVFDHTCRVSGVEGLNAIDGNAVAGAVIRVHGDYTGSSGHTRLQRLIDDGIVLLRGTATSIAAPRFAFVNLWQSIDAERPVLSHPLALCRPRSIDYPAHTWPYFMHFATRIGQNLAVSSEGSREHEWGYYPRMCSGEAILFISFDSEATARGAPVGVVHTAFDDPSIDGTGVPRRSIELRTVALWD